MSQVWVSVLLRHRSVPVVGGPGRARSDEGLREKREKREERREERREKREERKERREREERR